MFTELPARRTPGEPRRRWFTSGTMDLVVWLDEQDIVVAFQLCYGKPLRERAVTWKADHGFAHMHVDDGSVEDLGHKGTPVLQSGDDLDATQLPALFSAATAGLPDDVAKVVRSRLDKLSGTINER